MWSHPQEVVVEFADGTGWSADAIADVWPKQFAGSQQTVGVVTDVGTFLNLLAQQLWV